MPRSLHVVQSGRVVVFRRRRALRGGALGVVAALVVGRDRLLRHRLALVAEIGRVGLERAGPPVGDVVLVAVVGFDRLGLGVDGRVLRLRGVVLGAGRVTL